MGLRLTVDPDEGAFLLGGYGFDADGLGAYAVFQGVVEGGVAVEVDIAEQDDQRFDEVGFAGAVLADQGVAADGFARLVFPACPSNKM